MMGKKKPKEKKPEFKIIFSNPSSVEYLEVYIKYKDKDEVGYILGPGQGIESKVDREQEIAIRTKVYAGPLEVLKPTKKE